MKQVSLFALADPIAKMLGSWSVELTTYSILLRLVTVIILTSIIGCERSSKRHSAGLRTFVLVSFSSCVAMILDLYLMQEYRIGFPLLSSATIISAAMLSGNSIIFSSRSQIKGLTTSAALWFSGFLGFVIGAGQYTLSIIVYVLFLCILTWFPSIEVYLNNRSNHFEIHLELKNSNYLRELRSRKPSAWSANRRHRGESGVCGFWSERVHHHLHHLQRRAEKVQDPPGDHSGTEFA